VLTHTPLAGARLQPLGHLSKYLYSLQKRMPAGNSSGITPSASAQSYHKHMGLVEPETGKF